MTQAINKYSLLSGDELENHFSNFLIDSWSYSAVATFARNEKEFERRYIYREPSRRSATTVAGTAYHAALQHYFECLGWTGVEATIAEMQEKAFEVIDNMKANDWKLGKKTPTVEKCVEAATKTANALITNFYKERSLYTSDIAEVIAVEVRTDQWLVVNGVDIPLPCHGQIDLVVKLKDGRIAIIDHKSKSAYTDDAELAYTGAKQAIVYALSWENANPGLPPVDEVWYMENKHSTNKDGSPQLKKMVIVLDPKYEFVGNLPGCEVISDITEIEKRMKELVEEMQERAKTGANSKTLIVFDEFADAVSSARSGKELDIKEIVTVGQDRNGLPKKELKTVGREKSLEENLKMLLQKGRSLGYRIVAATQRASTKVITGDAKVNFPVQVCFRVPKAVDSKVVLDEEGAETLAGRGDGLIKSPEYFGTVRFQGFYKP